MTTRSDDETSRLGETHRHRSQMTSALASLDQQINTILASITSPPDGLTTGQLAAALTDHELLALDAWTAGNDPVIRAESERRADLYERQLRQLRPYVLRTDI